VVGIIPGENYIVTGLRSQKAGKDEEHFEKLIFSKSYFF
jgi:hypothetical protein